MSSPSRSNPAQSDPAQSDQAQSDSADSAPSPPDHADAHAPASFGSPNLAPGTVAVTAGRPTPVPDAPLNHPVVLASTFVAGGDLEYGRYANPTWTAFEDALGELEGGRTLAFSSGLAAVSALLDRVPPGGAVVAPRHAYLGTLGQLAELDRLGRVRARLVDVADTNQVVAACTDASMLWLEAPTNPALEVADIAACCAAARAAGALSVVDNTFATPILQRPLDLGADVVVHSATKYLAGHSDVVLGAAVTRDDATYDALLGTRKLRGGIPGAFEAWLALRGMRTLPLRVERACANAAELARRLQAHPAISRVRYPGLPEDPGYDRASRQMSAYGAVLSVELDSPLAAETLTHGTRLWVHATSLGGVESTLERRRRWSGESPTIPEGLVRLSVGVEDVEDLWADLAQALP